MPQHHYLQKSFLTNLKARFKKMIVTTFLLLRQQSRFAACRAAVVNVCVLGIFRRGNLWIKKPEKSYFWGLTYTKGLWLSSRGALSKSWSVISLRIGNLSLVRLEWYLWCHLWIPPLNLEFLISLEKSGFIERILSISEKRTCLNLSSRRKLPLWYWIFFSWVGAAVGQ